MKICMAHKFLYTIPVTAMLLTAAVSQAATITGSYLGLLAHDGAAYSNVEISLFDPANSYILPNPSMSSTYSAGTTTLNGIQDYHFYSSGAATPSLSLAGGSLISDALAASVSVRSNRRRTINFYTTKSPALPYDASLKGIDLSGTGTLTGTISLAGLNPNTPVNVYLITLNRNPNHISITPYNNGIAGTRLNDLVIASPENGENVPSYLSLIQISDFSDIDRIDFEVQGNQAGLHGIIVTQIPEPSTLLLTSLSSLLLLHRRRC
jgi:hypothetical protein